MLADKRERLREEWVKDQLVEAGRARSRALGWPDAYAYTKALGERALLTGTATSRSPSCGPRSSRARCPSPARLDPRLPDGRTGHHLLRPGPAEGVPRPARRRGRRHPGRPGRGRHAGRGRRRPRPRRARPSTTGLGQPEPAALPPAGRPGAGLVHRAPALRHRGPADRGARMDVPRPGPGPGPAPAGQLDLRAASGSWPRCPSGARRPSWAPGSRRRRTQADRALCYVELYGAYTETEARFRVDRTPRAVRTASPTTAQPSASIRPSSSGPPTCTTSTSRRGRARPGAHHADPPGGPMPRRPGPRRDPGRRTPAGRLRPREHADRVERGRVLGVAGHAATSDGRTGPVSRATLREAPALLALDRRDRSDFLRHFYRRYEGAPADRLRATPRSFRRPAAAEVLPRSHPAVRHHRALGHRTMLITGALDVVVEPLRPLFDEVVCASLGEATTAASPGELDRGAPDRRGPGADADGVLRAEQLIGESVAYADSASDLPMFEAVGVPVAVNAEAKLAAIARQPRLARRALVGPGRPAAPMAADGPRAVRAPSAPTCPRRTGGGAPVKALQYERKLPRFAAARVARPSPAPGGGAGSAPCGSPTRPARAARPRLAARAPRCSPASAGRTWPRSMAVARASSSRSSASRSCPATRWWRSSRGDDRVVVEPVLRLRRRGHRSAVPGCAAGRRTTASASPSATCARAADRVTAPTPAADGPRGLVAHSPSCTRSPRP